MAGAFRIPGPLGISLNDPPLDGGTLALTRMPAPDASPMPWRPPLLWPSAAPDVSMLFMAGLNPVRGLTDADFELASATLNLEVPLMRAVAEVESPRGAFDDQGRPAILYERHYFHRLTGGRFDRDYPDLSNPVRGRYGKFSEQFDKLKRAMALDAHAALQSVSMGRFQIMGTHYAKLGYATPQHMMRAMMASEVNHLKAFVAYLRAHPSLVNALRNHQWATFARGYNGPDYAENKYDQKIKDAYERIKASSAQASATRASGAPSARQR